MSATPAAETGSAHGPLLTTSQAADYLGMRPATLEQWRWRGDQGPRFVALSRRAVRYRRTDLDDFIKSRLSGG